MVGPQLPFGPAHIGLNVYRPIASNGLWMGGGNTVTNLQFVPEPPHPFALRALVLVLRSQLHLQVGTSTNRFR